MTSILCSDQKNQELLDNFLQRWPLERLRAMQIEDYTRYGSKDHFTYWLEQKTPGGIGGGNSFKFGVFARNPEEAKADNQTYRYDASYAWSASLGATAQEAFAKVKEGLLQIVEGLQSEAFPGLSTSPFWGMIAWKIAYLYQSPQRPQVIACFKEEDLRRFFRRTGLDPAGLSMAELHQRAVGMAGGRDMQTMGMHVWIHGQRRLWKYVYGMNGGADRGRNDLPTLLAEKAIRADWETGGSLEGLADEETQGKAECEELFRAPQDAPEETGDSTNRGRRPPLDFDLMQIPAGATLVSIHNPQVNATVVGPKKVSFEGEEMSLTAATRRMLAREAGINYLCQPSPRWLYKGRKLSEIYNETFPESTRPTHYALMGWLFAKRMLPEDLVFAHEAGTENYVLGMVSSPYRHEPDRTPFTHAVSVQWLEPTPRAIPAVKGLITQRLTDLKNWANEIGHLASAFQLNMDNLPEILVPPITAAMPASPGETLKPQPTNVILYGPPGTGKTYRTKRHAIETCIGKDRYSEAHETGDFQRLLAKGQVEFTTFHQSYDYADFVVGFKPETSGDTMVFKPKPGLLLRIAQRARENPSQQYLLIMDEVNRGNISKIFGELITLIEKDKRESGDFPLRVTLPCSCPGFLTGENHDQFSLPSNVHFLGTMNTADRSIALLDTALRRRFQFIEMPPKPSQNPVNLSGINLRALLEKLNKALLEKLTRDHQIGHAWLPMITAKYGPLKPQPDAEAIARGINENILPLIDEWFYDDAEGKFEVLKGLVEQSAEDPKRLVVTAETLRKYAPA
jgi:hypothetical protein